ncbi:hypothetical protein PybrP1_011468 [[Pythium] brassicae (nom. inval.)]|nr:hypothetical protein PybrP1_011468 [[Pythium] brassicae (nom. inval.)]
MERSGGEACESLEEWGERGDASTSGGLLGLPRTSMNLAGFSLDVSFRSDLDLEGSGGDDDDVDDDDASLLQSGGSKASDGVAGDAERVSGDGDDDGDAAAGGGGNDDERDTDTEQAEERPDDGELNRERDAEAGGYPLETDASDALEEQGAVVRIRQDGDDDSVSRTGGDREAADSDATLALAATSAVQTTPRSSGDRGGDSSNQSTVIAVMNDSDTGQPDRVRVSTHLIGSCYVAESVAGAYDEGFAVQGAEPSGSPVDPAIVAPQVAQERKSDGRSEQVEATRSSTGSSLSPENSDESACPADPSSLSDTPTTDVSVVLPIPLPLETETDPPPASLRPYNVRDLFPVVYEAPPANRGASKTRRSLAKAHERRRPDHAAPVARADSAAKPATSTPKDSITNAELLTPTRSPRRARAPPPSNSVHEPHVQPLRKQLDAARLQLARAEQTIRLHQVADGETRALRQRNARMKQQLDVLTADLQRTKATNAALQCANELFAAKVPHLQQELLDESCQADEKYAQAVQMQLSAAQLKARVHVLQSRNEALEAQSKSARAELRECQKELRRKTATLVATTEKLGKLEADASELRSAHAQDAAQWRTKAASALQRLEAAKAKHAGELSRQREQLAGDAKALAAKAARKQRELEAVLATRECDLVLRRREAEAAKLALHKRTREALALESLLRKAHHAEAALRRDVAALNAGARAAKAEDERTGAAAGRTRSELSRQAVRPASGAAQAGSGLQAMRRPRQRSSRSTDKLLFPLDLLLQELEAGSDSDDDAVRTSRSPREQHCKCCALLLCDAASLAPEPREGGDDDTAEVRESGSGDRVTPSPCGRCDDAQTRARDAMDAIQRLRVMHASELKAQTEAFTHMLQVGSRRGASPASRGVGALDIAGTSA